MTPQSPSLPIETIQLATLMLLIAQMTLLTVDELYYHRRRELGWMESLGHPLDSLVFLGTVAMAAYLPAAMPWTAAYAACAILSSVLITKDEFIHAKACAPGEHWLHALLFVIHAPILIGISVIWQSGIESKLLPMLPPLVAAWMFYQLIYWTGHHVRGRLRTLQTTPHGQQQFLRRAR